MKDTLEDRRANAVEGMIFTVRGQKVMLDSDLATLYGVETKTLNRALRRNQRRFPADFCFRLAAEEVTHLRCQIGTSRWGGRRYVPYVFTEHGAIMAATVLNSVRAVDMSVFVVRAFVKMREQILNRAETEKRLAEIENVLLSHDEALQELYQKIKPLLLPPPIPPSLPIGFHVREPRASYATKRCATPRPS